MGKRLYTPLQVGEIGGLGHDPYVSPWSRTLLRRDNLLLTKGGAGPQNIELYLSLLNDPVVMAALDKMASEITQREWSIEPHSNTDADKSTASFVYDCLSNLGSSVDQERAGKQLLGGSNGINSLLRSLLEPVVTGISINEIKWQLTSKHQILPVEVKPRDPRRLIFLLLDDGLIEPRLLTQGEPTEGIPLPPRSMVIHRYWASHTNDVYGSGLGRHIYNLVEYRHAQLRNWMAYADRFTLPTAIGKYPLSLPKDEVIVLENGLRGLGRETAVTVPEGVDISWLKAEGDPGVFEKILTYCDTQISNLVSGESTIGQQGSGGSRARDSVADSLRVRKCKAISDMLCDTLNNTLIKWIVELNFGSTTPRPKLVIDFSDLDTAVNRADLLRDVEKLTQIGYEVEESWLSKQLRMPIKKIKNELDMPQGGDI